MDATSGRCFLLYSELARFLEGDACSRNINEGEAVLNSGLLISCGCKSRHNNVIEIVALCLQTSAMKKDPHVITGEIIISHDDAQEKVKIVNFTCTCKAGASSKCKHVASTLWFLNRNDVMSLDDMSVTDLKCLWNEKKTPLLNLYEPKPLIEFCHVKALGEPKFKIPANFKNKALDSLVASAPDSTISKHKRGRLSETVDPKASTASTICVDTLLPEVHTEQIQSIIQATVTSEPLLELPQLNEADLQPCCQKVYSNLQVNVPQAVELCQETAISRQKWKEQRQFRITGSRCYAVYTQGQRKEVDWHQKASRYFWPKDFYSTATIHGITNEPLARAKYMEIVPSGYSLEETGFIVSPLHPWMGYSPDGVVFKNNKPAKLVEIKCPLKGRDSQILQVLDACPYLVPIDKNNLDQGRTLKKKHMYNGQVQLGMAMLGVTECDLVIYSPFDSNIAIFPIEFDKVFVTALLIKLQNDYFNHMLHQICLQRAKQ